MKPELYNSGKIEKDKKRFLLPILSTITTTSLLISTENAYSEQEEIARAKNNFVHVSEVSKDESQIPMKRGVAVNIAMDGINEVAVVSATIEQVIITQTPPLPISLEPCGYDLPPCWVAERESNGDYNAVNSNGCYQRDRNGEMKIGCYGKWQFSIPTWDNYKGYYIATDAPPEIQDEKARILWDNGNGCSHWAACK